MKTQDVIIEDGKSKHIFRIRKMPATQAYDFIMRAILIFADSGMRIEEQIDINAEIKDILKDGILQALRGVNYEKARPLLEQLIECCTRIVKDNKGVMEYPCTMDTLDSFIENPITIFKLQMEAAKVSFAFFSQGDESQSSSQEPLNIGKPSTQKV